MVWVGGLGNASFQIWKYVSVFWLHAEHQNPQIGSKVRMFSGHVAQGETGSKCSTQKQSWNRRRNFIELVSVSWGVSCDGKRWAI